MAEGNRLWGTRTGINRFAPTGEDAVRRYQADRGLKVDGLLNPGGETESSLRRRFGPPAGGRVRKVRNREISLLYNKISDVEGKLATRRAELQTRLQNRPDAPSFDVTLPDLGAVFSRDPRKRAFEWGKTGAENEAKRREYARDSQVRGLDDDGIGHIQAEIAELEAEQQALTKAQNKAYETPNDKNTRLTDCYRKKVGEDP